MPSSAPSSMPSGQPSAIPSAQPSAVPSSTPSDGVVYWLTTSMTTYVDEGVCGPRGDDAVADLSPCRNGHTVEFSFEGTQAEPFLDVNGCNYSLILYHECIPDHLSQTTTLTLQKQVTLPDPMPAEGSAQYIALADGFRDEIENAILAIIDPETQVGARFCPICEDLSLTLLLKTVTVTILSIGTNGGRRLVGRRLQEGTVESEATVTTEITCEESCAGVDTTESTSALEESAAAATGSTVTGSTSESVIASMEPSSAPSNAPSSQPSAQPSAIPSVQPSNAPSSKPSSSPSSRPSAQPSAAPSAQPSAIPSMNPSISGQPSSMPSENPSMSIWPTSQPSESPSISTEPSSIPSSHPSSSVCRGEFEGGHPTLLTIISFVISAVGASIRQYLANRSGKLPMLYLHSGPSRSMKSLTHSIKSIALKSAVERSFGKPIYLIATERPAKQYAFRSAK